MMFEKPLSLPILPCSSCNSTGLKNWSRCAVCQGTALGWFIRGKWLYWYYGVFLTGADVPDDAEPVRAVATMASGTVWHVFELLD
jgi:hypothetical protein